MSTVTRPSGRLPARVYWTRRLLVLVVALGLVFGISHLLGGSRSDAPGPSATPAGASSSPSGSSSASGATTRATPRQNSQNSQNPKGPKNPQKSTRPKKTNAPPAVPTGRCDDADIAVEPRIRTAYAVSDVAITLKLRTVEAAACNWEVAADSVVVKLSSGSDRIWSSQNCPQAIPRQTVVVRKKPATKVDVIWNGQRSDAECSRSTLWAEPGFYHAEAAALGGDPTDTQFELKTPAPLTITKAPDPKPKKHKKKSESD